MKVHINITTNSYGIRRVHNALVKYAPKHVEFTQSPEDADLVVFHVIGRHDTLRDKIEALQRKNTPYAMIQYCIKSTQRPKAIHWTMMWHNAKVVWSYYNLIQIQQDEGISFPFNFYYAPLGVDPEVFYDRHDGALRVANVIVTSGKHALSESTKECILASQRVNRNVIHLGHELRRGRNVECVSNLHDSEVAGYYSQSEFVSGLRRTEGFELPVIEGLMCGARPIVFDRAEMKHWFKDFAVFIPEGTREEVVDDLEQIFKKGAPPVTNEEKERVKRKFDWKTIIEGFWQKALK